MKIICLRVRQSAPRPPEVNDIIYERSHDVELIEWLAGLQEFAADWRTLFVRHFERLRQKQLGERRAV